MTNTICGEFTWVPMTMGFFVSFKKYCLFPFLFACKYRNSVQYTTKEIWVIFFCDPPHPGLKPRPQAKFPAQKKMVFFVYEFGLQY